MNYFYILLWSLFQSFIFIVGFFLQKNNDDLSILNKLDYSVYISRGAGLCLSITPALLLLPMCRYTVTCLRNKFSFLNSILPEFSIYFHKICSYTILFWSIIHMTCHYLNFYGVQHTLKLYPMYILHYNTFAGLSGHFMIVSLFVIFSFSTLYFRKFKYNIFLLCHHFFMIFFIMYPIHGIGCFVKTNSNKCVPYYSSVIVSPFIIIYICERLIREFYNYKTCIIDVKYFDEDTFKIYLTCPSGFSYKPGQYILIKCKELSSYQWHPFTISSSPNEQYIELTIRCLGDWTKSLRSHLINDVNKYTTSLQITSAFGSPIDTICNYNAVVLIASGIGITPYISTIKYIIQEQSLHSIKIKKIDLIWVNRDLSFFKWFKNELVLFEQQTSIIVNLHMFLTHKISDINDIRLITSETIPFLNYIYKTNIPIRYGRPNFNAFFNSYLQTNNNLYVGCFVCSSKTLETAVHNACDMYSNKNVDLIFHSEKFS